MKRTKIVCTIGPASRKSATLEAMIRAGMNVARLNFSHGTHEDHAKLSRAVLRAAKREGQTVAILQDLQGPKIRVGDLPEKGVKLTKGRTVIFTTGVASGSKIPVGYKQLHKDVKKGDQVLLDDGLLEVKVKAVKDRDIHCLVVTGGKLTSHKGMNFPKTELSVSSMSAKDRRDVAFGVRLGVDFIALSFVRSAADIRRLRALIEKEQKKARIKANPPINIIAKIEKPQALENFDEILDEVDGIMVARGDLGIETPAEDVPLHQKMMIQKCLKAAKPVIVATQMLDSMIRNPRPTRAEISDVANAIIDHTDAIMLSGESATGEYPVNAVEMMARTARDTEESRYDDLKLSVEDEWPLDPEVAVHKVAGMLARMTDIVGIVTFASSGATARLLSCYRPELPIYAGVSDSRVMRQLALSWGITPILIKDSKDLDSKLSSLVQKLKNDKKFKQGDRFLAVMNVPKHSGRGQLRLSLEEV